MLKTFVKLKDFEKSIFYSDNFSQIIAEVVCLFCLP